MSFFTKKMAGLGTTLSQLYIVDQYLMSVATVLQSCSIFVAKIVQDKQDLL